MGVAADELKKEFDIDEQSGNDKKTSSDNDKEYEEKLKNIIANGGDTSNSSSYKKYEHNPYYDFIYHFNNNPKYRDFYFKNYNGYSNRTYTNKYPRRYWDQTKSIAELNYKQYPAKAYSRKLVRDTRDPNARGLPGGTFRKQSGRVKPI